MRRGTVSAVPFCYLPSLTEPPIRTYLAGTRRDAYWRIVQERTGCIQRTQIRSPAYLELGTDAVQEQFMSSPVAPRWKSLCEVAKDEKDPRKLIELVKEITRELEQQEAREQPEAHPQQ
jgi:hypothetical protein